VAVTGAGGRLCGIFTDGDLRRLVETGVDLRNVRAGEVMRSQPFTVSPQALAAEAANLMEERKISSVLVLDTQGVLCGALTSNDLMRAKVI
jgi:arabinose-5-phosphate isomerase